MKRLVAVMLVFVMALGCVSAFADNVEWKEFESACNIASNSNVKMSLRIDGEGALFDILGLSSLVGTVAAYDLNIVSNDKNTAAQAEGTMALIPSDNGLIPSVGCKMWLDFNFENADDFKYVIVIQPTGTDEEAKYVYIDFNDMPEFKEMYKELFGFLKTIDGGLLYEDLLKDERFGGVADKIAELSKEIKPVFENGTYTLTVSEEQIKKAADLLADEIVKFDYDLTDSISASEILSALEMFKKLHIFDSEKAVVVSVKTDAEKKTSDLHFEINIDTNVYDLAKVLEPGDATFDESDRENLGIKLSVILDGEATPLETGYNVNFPKLTEDNSIKMFDVSVTDKDEYTIDIIYGGEKIEFYNKPVVLENRTFLPLRELAGMFGIGDEYISYDEETEEVRINGGGTEIVMTIGSRDTYINGEWRELDVPAFTLNERTYIPVRFVSEMFGKSVDYSEDESGLTVFIGE